MNLATAGVEGFIPCPYSYNPFRTARPDTLPAKGDITAGRIKRDRARHIDTSATIITPVGVSGGVAVGVRRGAAGQHNRAAAAAERVAAR